MSMDKQKKYYEECYKSAQYKKALDGYLMLLNNSCSRQEKANLEYKVGKCYYKIGYFSAALSHYHQIIDNDGFTDHVLRGDCYNEIATVMYKQGQLKDALKYIEQAQKFVDGSTPKKAEIYNNLGRIYYKMKEFQKALFYFQLSLSIKEQIFSLNDIEIAVSYNNLGVIYMELDNLERALKYLEISLSIRREKIGENHLDTATTYNNIASVYLKKNKVNDAREYFEKALEIREKIVGEQHLDTAMTYYGLGMLEVHLKSYKEAFRYFEEAYKVVSLIKGEDNDDSLKIKNEMDNCREVICENEKGI